MPIINAVARGWVGAAPRMKKVKAMNIGRAKLIEEARHTIPFCGINMACMLPPKFRSRVKTPKPRMKAPITIANLD